MLPIGFRKMFSNYKRVLCKIYFSQSTSSLSTDFSKYFLKYLLPLTFQTIIHFPKLFRKLCTLQNALLSFKKILKSTEQFLSTFQYYLSVKKVYVQNSTD